ncbi:hypothetical protein DDB_G0292644 [Dictyostelium discoideum AX4]|uniref:Transmembrane protein n=1 Tax=Dictyostelium discoideum TaxID=44689 RepID=Q54CX3_DICDI|nr:hypothetical protein DDB_G0292644 [Dictyostelium discoideum AX4]EAL61125.1 hypothetical protein DDB_G0292644 [Dictyostelium discoideum AX4]|eukprot:XP_629547.1 hypothetical protein DDB_G0292644 [Dictyostelium discoideum AX4]
MENQNQENSPNEEITTESQQHTINTNVSQEELENEIKRSEESIKVTEVTTTEGLKPTDTREYINKNGICRHRDNCAISTLKTIIRGFAIGYGLRAGIALLTGLILRKLYRNPRKLINQSILHKDPIGFGLFLGFYTGGFKGINCLLRAIRGKEDGLNSIVAGFIAGSAMMFSKSTEMALYLFARALESLFNAAVKRGYLKSYKHGDSVLFCLCTTILFHGFVWEPTAVRPSYMKFISKVAGKNRDIGAITSVIRDMYYQQQKK